MQSSAVRGAPATFKYQQTERALTFTLLVSSMVSGSQKQRQSEPSLTIKLVPSVVMPHPWPVFVLQATHRINQSIDQSIHVTAKHAIDEANQPTGPCINKPAKSIKSLLNGLFNQPINHRTNIAINHIINPSESIHHTINHKSIIQSINHTINPSYNQFIIQSIDHQTNHTINPSYNRSLHQPIIQSTTKS